MKPDFCTYRAEQRAPAFSSCCARGRATQKERASQKIKWARKKTKHQVWEKRSNSRCFPSFAAPHGQPALRVEQGEKTRALGEDCPGRWCSLFHLTNSIKCSVHTSESSARAHRKTCSGCPVPAILFLLSCPWNLVLAIIFCLFLVCQSRSLCPDFLSHSP